MVSVKECKCCKTLKTLNQFHKRGDNDFRSECKICRLEKESKRNQLNKEHVSKLRKNNYEKHKANTNEKKRLKYKANPEPFKTSVKTHYQKNKQNKLEYAKQYRSTLNNTIKQATYMEEYRKTNKESIRKTRYNWEKNELETNPAYRIAKSLRGRKRAALAKIKVKSLTSALKDLSQDDLQLKAIFESKWLEGMNWSNYGSAKDKWNIDHYIPFCYFSKEEMEIELNQRILNHPINLRPMWAVDNLKKSGSIPLDVEQVIQQILSAITNE